MTLLVAMPVCIFLLLFLVLPVLSVVLAAFGIGSQSATLVYIVLFFQQELYREAFSNSLQVAFLSMLFASLIAVPLAWIATRMRFRGWLLVQVLGVLPLVMPPFVAAFALQPFLGANGAVNLLLQRWFGFTLPFMEGMNGVVLVESIHYFPFVLLNLITSLRRIDLSMEESAVTLGSTRWRRFRRIVLPLALPGYVAGAAIVFMRAFEDLGTPLILGVTNMLAPLTYLRVMSVGVDDPLSYVIAMIMLAFSALTLYLAGYFLRDKDNAYMPYLGGGVMLPVPARPVLGRWPTVFSYGWVVVTLLFVLLPHLGLLSLSLADIWSFSILPDSWTTRNYDTIATDSGAALINTFLYCGLAAGIDVTLGGVIAYVVLRTRLAGRNVLARLAGVSLAVPGMVLALGYLRFFRDINVPLSEAPFSSTWGMIALAYAVQQLPYVVKVCMTALQAIDPNLEAAAENLGSTRTRVLQRIVIPLMAGGLLLGFVVSFMAAATELPITMLLSNNEAQAPMSYEIYLYMQSVSGRGPGAALAIVAIAVVAICASIIHILLRRRLRSTTAMPS
ncbi:ABC transporter permease [Herbaspirillum hiltneri]|nr:iron ABC transporter permease [Herbaspirillum hiltneri]